MVDGAQRVAYPPDVGRGGTLWGPHAGTDAGHVERDKLKDPAKVPHGFLQGTAGKKVNGTGEESGVDWRTWRESDQYLGNEAKNGWLLVQHASLEDKMRCNMNELMLIFGAHRYFDPRAVKKDMMRAVNAVLEEARNIVSPWSQLMGGNGGLVSEFSLKLENRFQPLAEGDQEANQDELEENTSTRRKIYDGARQREWVGTGGCEQGAAGSIDGGSEAILCKEKRWATNAANVDALIADNQANTTDPDISATDGTLSEGQGANWNPSPEVEEELGFSDGYDTVGDDIRSLSVEGHVSDGGCSDCEQPLESGGFYVQKEAVQTSPTGDDQGNDMELEAAEGKGKCPSAPGQVGNVECDSMVNRRVHNARLVSLPPLHTVQTWSHDGGGSSDTDGEGWWSDGSGEGNAVAQGPSGAQRGESRGVGDGAGAGLPNGRQQSTTRAETNMTGSSENNKGRAEPSRFSPRKHTAGGTGGREGKVGAMDKGASETLMAEGGGGDGGGDPVKDNQADGERDWDIFNVFDSMTEEGGKFGYALEGEILDWVQGQGLLTNREDRVKVANEVAVRLVARLLRRKFVRVLGNGNCVMNALALGLTGDVDHGQCLRQHLRMLINKEIAKLKWKRREMGHLPDVEAALLTNYEAAKNDYESESNLLDASCLGLFAKDSNLCITFLDRRRRDGVGWWAGVHMGDTSRPKVHLVRTTDIHYDSLLEVGEQGHPSSLNQACPFAGCKQRERTALHPANSEVWRHTDSSELTRMELTKLMLTQGVWPDQGKARHILSCLEAGGQQEIEGAITEQDLSQLGGTLERARLAFSDDQFLSSFVDEKGNTRSGGLVGGAPTADKDVNGVEECSARFGKEDDVISLQQLKNTCTDSKAKKDALETAGFGVWKVVGEKPLERGGLARRLAEWIWEAGLSPVDPASAALRKCWGWNRNERAAWVVARAREGSKGGGAVSSAEGERAKVLAQPLGFETGAVLGALMGVGYIHDPEEYTKVVQHTLVRKLKKLLGSEGGGGEAVRIRVSFRSFKLSAKEQKELGKLSPQIFLIEGISRETRQLLRRLWAGGVMTMRDEEGKPYGPPVGFSTNPMTAAREAARRPRLGGVSSDRQGKVVEFTVDPRRFLGGGWGGWDSWVRQELKQKGIQVVRNQQMKTLRFGNNILAHVTMATEEMARRAVMVLDPCGVHGFHRTVEYEQAERAMKEGAEEGVGSSYSPSRRTGSDGGEDRGAGRDGGSPSVSPLRGIRRI